jgi:hypothetical protein
MEVPMGDCSTQNRGQIDHRKRARVKPAPQPDLPTRKALDLRLAANRQFNQTVAGIISDLGGKDNISTVLEGLVEAYAGARSNLDSLNVRMLLGQDIDLTEYSTVASTLVRLAQRMGLERRTRDVTPSLAEYLVDDEASDRNDLHVVVDNSVVES